MDSPFAFTDRELQLAARLGLGSNQSLRVKRLAIALAAVTWLPLLVLSLIAGSAYGDAVAIPFFNDFLPHGRYLIALPLLVILHPTVDRRIATAIVRLRNSVLVAPADEALLHQALERALSLWRSRTILVVLVVLSVMGIGTVISARSLIEVSSWMILTETGTAVFSTAGWWNVLVGGPVFRLLLLLAFWKLLVWYWFLRQLSRMPLRYQRLHPDGTAGLGILDWVQVGFAPMVAALSIQLGCIIADAVTYQGAELASFRIPVAAFAVLVLVLFFAPLLMFHRPLALACARTEATFHAWASRAARQVDSALLKTGDEEVAVRLSSPEISSLTDAAALFANTVQTRRIPVTGKSLKAVLAATFLPMLLPMLPLLPLKEIAKGLASIVL